MNRILLIVFLCFSLFAVHAQTKKMDTKTTATAPVLRNSIDSFSYAIGLEGATYYKMQGANKLNTDILKKAFDDVYANKTLLLTAEQSTTTIQKKIQAFMENKLQVEKDSGRTFLAQNKKRAGVVELPNGLQYEIIKAGTGAKPIATDTVTAHYIGTLISGTEFDNSYKRGQPLQIPVNGVITGWTQALEMMPVGSKWKLYIPSDLAYGDRGAGSGLIPGGATLVFEVELLSILKGGK